MRPRLLIAAAAIGLAAACSRSSLTAPSTSPTTTPTATVLTMDTFVAAVRGQSATVDLSAPNVQDTLFSVPAVPASINGVRVSVYEYPSTDALANETASISRDGSFVGRAIVDWIDQIHFYRSGRVMVVYAGRDVALQQLLERVLGRQFAGAGS